MPPLHAEHQFITSTFLINILQKLVHENNRHKAFCQQQRIKKFVSFILIISFISYIFTYCNPICPDKIISTMSSLDTTARPTKREQVMAIEAYNVLKSALNQIGNNENEIEIEIEETGSRVKLPNKALQLLVRILKAMREGKPISILPVATEVTTQKAAEILGCSRPHLVKLLEEGTINFTKVGKHRRILLEDVLKYQNEMKKIQKQQIIEIMNFDEDLGLYDT